MLDELRTFVVFADVGSLHKAAARLFLTPSAVTRQIQRLEAALDAPLLDRRLKPARLTPAGRAVLERSRELLRSLDDLVASASPAAEPTGRVRLGLSHALAQPGLVGPIERLRRRYPGLQTSFSSDMTGRLLDAVVAADLEMALVLIPAEAPLPPGAVGAVVATERFTLVRRRDRPAGAPAAPMEGPWILNPRGCLIRDAFEAHLERVGAPLRIAAEVMNLEMQLSLVIAGVGQGILPARFLARHPRRAQVTVLRRGGWEVDASIAFVRAGHLGRLEAVAQHLEAELREHFARRGGFGDRAARSS